MVTEVPTSQRWGGLVRLQPGVAPPKQDTFVIRDDDAWQIFLDRIPRERVQMKQPAPPSDDPLLARPPVDFTRDMVVVVILGDTLDRPGIERVVLEGDVLHVTYVLPAPGRGARPLGIGSYAAAVVPRHDTVELTPRETPFHQ
jgi:hypothetical protein